MLTDLGRWHTDGIWGPMILRVRHSRGCALEGDGSEGAEE